MPFLHNKRLRAVARHVPGLPALHRRVISWLILRRGVAELDYAKAKIRIRADTKKIIHSRLRPVAKEPWTVAWIEKNLRDGDVFYDIGANVGVYSLIAARVAPGASILSIEPGYATFASLCENLVLNGVADAIVPLPVVLGDETRLGSLSYSDVTAGAAIHTLDSNERGAYRQPVLMFRLDDLVERFELPPPTLVKLDVDGAEAAVLAGARDTLARRQLRSLVVEIEEEQTESVLRELGLAGLTLVDRIDDRYGEPLPGIWYGVFERP